MWNQTAYRTLREILGSLDRRRTVVHLHGYTKALSTSPVMAARWGGFATVCTLHDFFAACPNGAFFNYRQQAPCTLKALSAACLVTACDKRHPVHKAYRVVRGAVQRHIARFPAGVGALHFVIAPLRRAVAPLSGQRNATVHPLTNIIDVPRQPPVDPGGNRNLMVVGRLDEEKGVLLATRAAEAAGLPIVFVGDGPYRGELEAAGARVTGWLAAAEVHRELNAARCLVFPSLWYETFGLVVAEAAARGVPAIVSDISAPADRITDGQDGWLFRAGDLADLTERMLLTRDDAVGTRNGSRRVSGVLGCTLADPMSPMPTLCCRFMPTCCRPTPSAAATTAQACASNVASARCSATASRPRQSMKHAPLVAPRAHASISSEPNHPTA